MERKVTTSSVEDNEQIHINNTMQNLKRRGYSNEKIQLYYEVQLITNINMNSY